MGHDFLLSPVGGLALVALVGLALPALGQTVVDFEQLPSLAELPDPLIMIDGTRVAIRQQWLEKRKPELKAQFQHYMYGVFPAAPQITATEEKAHRNCLGGKATLKQIAITLGPAGCPPIHLLLVVPNAPARSGPAPTFLALNFSGNHTVMDDPTIALPTGWMPDGPGVEQHRATEAGRAKEVAKWEVEQTIDRGYALATFYYGDVMPDKPDFQEGIFPYFRAGDRSQRKADEWGAIAMWAWGLQRAVDYLVTDADVDAKRIVVFGHSRNGKAALLAAAFDDRVAAVIPHQAGCGGSAPSRRTNPKSEPVARINKVFPHWFAERFHQFGDHEDRLPFDQHELIALCAPRAVLLTNGDQDEWADPPGQFRVLLAAKTVYRLFGCEGIADEVSEPVSGKTVGAELSYYVRPAGHTVDKQYWGTFLDFADRIFGIGK